MARLLSSCFIILLAFPAIADPKRDAFAPLYREYKEFHQLEAFTKAEDEKLLALFLESRCADFSQSLFDISIGKIPKGIGRDSAEYLMARLDLLFDVRLYRECRRLAN